MPRRRLGVVLPVPAPWDAEIDGLRRACGDPMFGRVMPHLTLVPPVNVRDEHVGSAFAVARAAAGRSVPVVTVLGPAATFLPVSPTLYLAVGAEEVGALARLLADVLVAVPGERTLRHPFVPHVTLAAEMAPARIAAAVAALEDYSAAVTFDVLMVLEEQPDHAWVPVMDVPLGPPVIVGRGGLPLELTPGTVVDLEAALVATARSPVPPGATPLVVTARRDGRVVGVLQGWTAAGGGRITAVDVAAEAAADEVDRHLVAHARSVAADRGCQLGER